MDIIYRLNEGKPDEIVAMTTIEDGRMRVYYKPSGIYAKQSSWHINVADLRCNGFTLLATELCNLDDDADPVVVEIKLIMAEMIAEQGRV